MSEGSIQEKRKRRGRRGRVTLLLGSMFSGKSSELLKIIERTNYQKVSACLIRPNLDTRNFIARNANHNSKFTVIETNQINISDVMEFDVVFIDEGHFITDLGVTCHKIALLGKTVYVAALPGDSDFRPWDEVSRLLPYIDRVRKIDAVCVECGYGSTFTFTDAKKNGQVLIGDKAYKALCRRCHDEFTRKD